ncbi:MAG: toll/interleukin-1 receptor domain-containing protein [Candidatus Sulfotelmatobacter sp.]
MKIGAAKPKSKAEFRFESVNIDSLFGVLDAVAFITTPTTKSISQFAGIDPRTAGKLLKNARLIGLIDSAGGDSYLLSQPYPFRGTSDQKRRVVREALLRSSIIEKIRQFMGLGDNLPNAMRKAMTVAGELNYDPSAIAPLVKWAQQYDALSFEVRAERLVTEAVAAKETRHIQHSQQRVVFISHSSKDKEFVRKLASDLNANGIQVWLDELRIQVGDSIPLKIAQGLAESDFFLIVVSHNSVNSEWIQKELDNALVQEIESKRVRVLPVKIDDANVPMIIRAKKHANFSLSYDEGLKELIAAIKAREVTADGR